MNDPNQPNLPAKSQFLVYRSEDGKLKIDVRLENETVWLTQQHMADLFQTTQQNISLHLQNIYEEGELQPAATHKEYLSVRQEGNRQVRRPLDFCNLDAVISVGYRVKSAVATRFRIWATQKERPTRRVSTCAPIVTPLPARRAVTQQPRATPWELGHHTIHSP